MATQPVGVSDSGVVGASITPSEGLPGWDVRYAVEKYRAGAADVRAGVYGATAGDLVGQPVRPYEVVEGEGNKLLNIGADLLWRGLTGNMSATTGLVNTYFNNGNAAIRVGDVATTSDSTHTGILATSASTNSATVGMEATYPLHQNTTSGGSTTNRNIAFRAVFSTNVANFDWNEWAIVNTTNSTVGPEGCLNRKAETLGTKTSAATWTFTCTISFST